MNLFSQPDVSQQNLRPSTMEEHLNGHSQQSISVIGYDYDRNPMIFFSTGLFVCTNLISSLIILITSLVVFWKLRGHQESMSDKSQEEHKNLMNVLILDAYVPMLLSLLLSVNFLICFIRHESM